MTSRLPAPRDLALLAKLPVSLLAALSAGAGFLAAAREPRRGLLAAVAGTLLLSAGAAALNEVLDREADGRMERTRGRPIPAGRISARTAVALSAAAAAAGALVLWGSAGATPALLGLAALVLYDGLYTPAKRSTAFAFLPGALVGALPPAIGWTAAGGDPADARLLALGAFFLLWQVPHAWLLALRHADDLARGGFPVPTARFSRAQAGRITLAWILAASAAALLLPLFGTTAGRWSAFALAAAALLPLGPAARIPAGAADDRTLRDADRALRALAAAVIVVVSADGWLAG